MSDTRQPEPGGEGKCGASQGGKQEPTGYAVWLGVYGGESEGPDGGAGRGWALGRLREWLNEAQGAAAMITLPRGSQNSQGLGRYRAGGGGWHGSPGMRNTWVTETQSSQTSPYKGWLMPDTIGT